MVVVVTSGIGDVIQITVTATQQPGVHSVIILSHVDAFVSTELPIPQQSDNIPPPTGEPLSRPRENHINANRHNRPVMRHYCVTSIAQQSCGHPPIIDTSRHSQRSDYLKTYRWHVMPVRGQCECGVGTLDHFSWHRRCRCALWHSIVVCRKCTHITGVASHDDWIHHTVTRQLSCVL